MIFLLQRRFSISAVSLPSCAPSVALADACHANPLCVDGRKGSMETFGGQARSFQVSCPYLLRLQHGACSAWLSLLSCAAA